MNTNQLISYVNWNRALNEPDPRKKKHQLDVLWYMETKNKNKSKGR